MTGKRVYIETWGCQMNLHQSEGIAGVFSEAGYVLTGRLEDADIVLLNGCMVRQKAEDKVYGRIGAVAEEKARRGVLLGVGGCLGQVFGAKLQVRFPVVDFVFGSTGHCSLPEQVRQVERGAAATAVGPMGRLVEETPLRRQGEVVAMVTISEGCSNFCSYCIVPFARGPMRSREPDRILAEVEEACRNGYREVLLLGQNVNAYGTDRAGWMDFSELLSLVAGTGVARIRFTSSHPRDMKHGVWETMARHENVCPHIHLACQSGSSRVLRGMNRGYTREEFAACIRVGRKYMPHMNVTTDIIVGYSGETEEDFEETLSLLEELRFGSVYVAKYSPRPGTASAERPDDVEEAVKSERLQRVLALQREIARQENEKLVDCTVEVLVEGQSRAGGVYGRAADHRTVVVTGPAEPGDLVPVRIESASSAALYGAVLIPEEARNA